MKKNFPERPDGYRESIEMGLRAVRQYDLHTLSKTGSPEQNLRRLRRAGAPRGKQRRKKRRGCDCPSPLHGTPSPLVSIARNSAPYSALQVKHAARITVRCGWYALLAH